MPDDSSRQQAVTLLEEWLQQRLDADQYQWLLESIEKTLNSNSGKDLYITLGMIPRRLPRVDLALDDTELQRAQAARPGWDPSLWSVDGAARSLVLARLALHRPQQIGDTFCELCRTADVGESITLFSTLPLLPADERIDQQVGDGLRSNMRSVFEAIAHRNPYPKETFDQNRWNHMVLKALFVDSTLGPIQGLDERANAELARILCDYAHERWAADRAITPELWRCVGPFASGDMLDDLERALQSDNASTREGAALALTASNDKRAEDLLAGQPQIRAAIAQGELTWASLTGTSPTA